MPTSWTVEHEALNVHVVRVSMPTTADTFHAFLSSDWHYDHPHCDRDLLHSHLTEAMGLNAPIFAFGDTFCTMQGPGDRRMTKGKTRPEHEREDYLNALVEDQAEHMAPYANNLALFGQGNHETAMLKHHGVNVCRMLSDELHKTYAAPWVQDGGFAGFVRFMFHGLGNERSSVRVFYHHGFGGASPASRGVYKVNRRQAMAEADIYYDGHDHHRWVMPEVIERLSDKNKIKRKPILFVHGGNYKTSGGVGSAMGWEVEKGMATRPLGGYFVRFSWSRRSREGDPRIIFKAVEPTE